MYFKIFRGSQCFREVNTPLPLPLDGVQTDKQTYYYHRLAALLKKHLTSSAFFAFSKMFSGAIKSYIII